MTVTAQIIDVQVNAEAQSAAVSVSVQIGQAQQLTKENIDAAIGASEAGDQNKFYNEQGDWIEVESGQADAEFKISVSKLDCEFKGDWIKISHSEATNTKRIIVRRATVEDSNGEQELDLMIAYPAAETYIGTDIYRGFYIQDRHGLLSQTADWDVLNFDYDIEADSETKYSFLNHETGINVISDHHRDANPDNGNEWHANSTRVAFTSVFPEFKGDYIDTYIDPEANYSSIATAFEPTYYEKNRASIMIRPYSDAALWENYSAIADFLEIGSHGYNKDDRVNLTPSADIFLSHSVAVGAKKENDWQTAPQTTFGYGIEFFEITERIYLETAYTERGLRIYPHLGFQTWSNADRTVIWTEYAPHQTYINDYPNAFKIGDIVFINVPLEAPTFGGTHKSIWEFWYNPASLKRTIIDIQTIDGITYFTLDGAIWDTQLNGNNYIWIFSPMAYTPFGTLNGSTQSAATAVVGAKFAKIKQETGLGLRLIREACRQTAVLTNGTTTTTESYSGATTLINVNSTAEFPDEGIISISGQNFVYTSKTATSFIGLSQVINCSSGATVSLKWDVWRGFGQIDVQAAIAYLETNYINDDDYKATVQRGKINPVLDYEDLGDNDSVAKRMVEDLLSEKQDNILFVEETENKFLRDDNTFQTIDLSGKENTANKQNSLTADGTGTKFPTVDAVNGVLGDILTILNSI